MWESAGSEGSTHLDLTRKGIRLLLGRKAEPKGSSVLGCGDEKRRQRGCIEARAGFSFFSACPLVKLRTGFLVVALSKEGTIKEDLRTGGSVGCYYNSG